MSSDDKIQVEIRVRKPHGGVTVVSLEASAESVDAAEIPARIARMLPEFTTVNWESHYLER